MVRNKPTVEAAPVKKLSPTERQQRELKAMKEANAKAKTLHAQLLASRLQRRNEQLANQERLRREGAAQQAAELEIEGEEEPPVDPEMFFNEVGLNADGSLNEAGLVERQRQEAEASAVVEPPPHQQQQEPLAGTNTTNAPNGPAAAAGAAPSQASPTRSTNNNLQGAGAAAGDPQGTANAVPPAAPGGGGVTTPALSSSSTANGVTTITATTAAEDPMVSRIEAAILAGFRPVMSSLDGMSEKFDRLNNTLLERVSPLESTQLQLGGTPRKTRGHAPSQVSSIAGPSGTSELNTLGGKKSQKTNHVTATAATGSGTSPGPFQHLTARQVAALDAHQQTVYRHQRKQAGYATDATDPATDTSNEDSSDDDDQGTLQGRRRDPATQRAEMMAEHQRQTRLYQRIVALKKQLADSPPDVPTGHITEEIAQKKRERRWSPRLAALKEKDDLLVAQLRSNRTQLYSLTVTRESIIKNITRDLQKKRSVQGLTAIKLDLTAKMARTQDLIDELSVQIATGRSELEPQLARLGETLPPLVDSSPGRLRRQSEQSQSSTRSVEELPVDSHRDNSGDIRQQRTAVGTATGTATAPGTDAAATTALNDSIQSLIGILKGTTQGGRAGSGTPDASERPNHRSRDDRQTEGNNRKADERSNDRRNDRDRSRNLDGNDRSNNNTSSSSHNSSSASQTNGKAFKGKLSEIPARWKPNPLFRGAQTENARVHINSYKLMLEAMDLSPRDRCHGLFITLSPEAHDRWQVDMLPWLKAMGDIDDCTVNQFYEQFIRIFEGPTNTDLVILLQRRKHVSGEPYRAYLSALEKLHGLIRSPPREEDIIASAMEGVPPTIVCEVLKMNQGSPPKSLEQLKSIFGMLDTYDKVHLNSKEAAKKDNQPDPKTTASAVAAKATATPTTPAKVVQPVPTVRKFFPPKHQVNLAQVQPDEDRESGNESDKESAAEDEGSPDQQTAALQVFQALLGGGSKGKWKLPDPDTYTRLHDAARGCYNCGEKDHFSRNCPKPPKWQNNGQQKTDKQQSGNGEGSS